MKKITKVLIIVLSCFYTFITTNASTNTYERKEVNNYGVKKHWKVTEENIFNIKNTPLVNASEKIYDFSNILTDSEEEILYKKINEFVNKTNIEMVFVTVNLPYSYDYENEEYAADFYDYNDFGIEFENYSGILLLRNTYEDDPYYNVYTFGNAQLYFSYNRCEKVLDDIYYNFKGHYYLEGYSTFINEITNYYDSGIPTDMKNYEVDEDGFLKKKYVIPITPIFIGSSIVTLIIMIILINKNKMVKKATKASEYLNKNSIQFTRKEDVFLREHTTTRIISDSSSSGGGRSHSSSRGSSGGGHSSGGGRHG